MEGWFTANRERNPTRDMLFTVLYFPSDAFPKTQKIIRHPN